MRKISAICLAAALVCASGLALARDGTKGQIEYTTMGDGKVMHDTEGGTDANGAK